MRSKKKIFVVVSAMLILVILIMPFLVWIFMPSVDTCTIISLIDGASLLPKSVVQQGTQPCVYLLTADKSFWNDGYVAKRIDVNIEKTDEDSVLVSETFDPTKTFIVLGKVKLLDGMHVRLKK